MRRLLLMALLTTSISFFVPTDRAQADHVPDSKLTFIYTEDDFLAGVDVWRRLEWEFAPGHVQPGQSFEATVRVETRTTHREAGCGPGTPPDPTVYDISGDLVRFSPDLATDPTPWYISANSINFRWVSGTSTQETEWVKQPCPGAFDAVSISTDVRTGTIEVPASVTPGCWRMHHGFSFDAVQGTSDGDFALIQIGDVADCVGGDPPDNDCWHAWSDWDGSVGGSKLFTLDTDVFYCFLPDGTTTVNTTMLGDIDSGFLLAALEELGFEPLWHAIDDGSVMGSDTHNPVVEMSGVFSVCWNATDLIIGKIDKVTGKALDKLKKELEDSIARALEGGFDPDNLDGLIAGTLADLEDEVVKAVGKVSQWLMDLGAPDAVANLVQGSVEERMTGLFDQLDEAIDVLEFEVDDSAEAIANAVWDQAADIVGSMFSDVCFPVWQPSVVYRISPEGSVSSDSGWSNPFLTTQAEDQGFEPN